MCIFLFPGLFCMFVSLFIMQTIEVFPPNSRHFNCLNSFFLHVSHSCRRAVAARHTVTLTNPTSQIHFCICFVGKSDNPFYSSYCLTFILRYSRTSTKFTERKGESAWEGCQIQLFWCANANFSPFHFFFFCLFLPRGDQLQTWMLHMKMPRNNGDYIWKQDNRILLVL